MGILVSSLYSCEDVSDIYEVIDENTVINTITGLKKKATKCQRYWYYTFSTKDGKSKKITVHKINALAFINNGSYEVIEHINDDRDNNSVSNLKFSTQKDNIHSMYKNGNTNHPNERIFHVIDKDGNSYTGTSKEIVILSNGRIKRSSIYFLLQKNKTSGRCIKFIEEL